MRSNGSQNFQKAENFSENFRKLIFQQLKKPHRIKHGIALPELFSL